MYVLPSLCCVVNVVCSVLSNVASLALTRQRVQRPCRQRLNCLGFCGPSCHLDAIILYNQKYITLTKVVTSCLFDGVPNAFVRVIPHCFPAIHIANPPTSPTQPTTSLTLCRASQVLTLHAKPSSAESSGGAATNKQHKAEKKKAREKVGRHFFFARGSPLPCVGSSERARTRRSSTQHPTPPHRARYIQCSSFFFPFLRYLCHSPSTIICRFSSTFNRGARRPL